MSMVSNHSPISRKEIVLGSPISEPRTVEALNALSKLSAVYQDSDSYYSPVPMPNVTREDAFKEIARHHFRDFGIFSAENLSRFMSARMSEVRSTLAALEAEGLLKKGFFIRDDPTLMWMLASDVGKKQNVHRGTFALNTQDNLHVYLRQHIKGEIGQSRAVIFEGTRISGHFDGKLTYAGSKVENFEGSDRAYRFLSDSARSLGISIEKGKSAEQDDDWDAVEFYLKSNPGAVTRK